MTHREDWLIPERPYASCAEYLHAVGEDALAKSRRLAPEEILDEIVRSGLRGAIARPAGAAPARASRSSGQVPQTCRST